MGVFGSWVLGITAWHVWNGTLPHAFTMGAVGFAALLANAASFGSCGRIVVAMQTCVRLGFVRAMTFSAILRCCLRHLGFSGRAAAGPT